MSVVAMNIYRILHEKCLKQSAVAQKAGYTVNQFNAMLKGRKIIKADDIPKIAVALGVKVNELFKTNEHPQAG